MRAPTISTFSGDIRAPVSPSNRPPTIGSTDRRVEKLAGYPTLSEMGRDRQRQEFQEALLDAPGLEDLSCKWQAAILKTEQNRPKLRLINSKLTRARAAPLAA